MLAVRLIVAMLFLVGLSACSAENVRRGGVSTDVDPATEADAGGTTSDATAEPTPTPTPTPTPEPGDGTCDSISVEAERLPASVMIVLDASGSMYPTDYFGDLSGTDRWTPAVSAIRSVTNNLEGELSFGLMVFPGEHEVYSDAFEDVCKTGDVNVPMGSSTAQSISEALEGEAKDRTSGATPTAKSLEAAGEALASVAGNRAILLVTDGSPNCNEDLPGCIVDGIDGPDYAPGWACALDDVRSVDTVAALSSQGIQTYVVGIEPDAGLDDVLDRMAQAGGTGATEHYKVDDPAKLEAALAEIAGSFVSCSYELAMAPNNERYVRVVIDGQEVPHTSTAGSGEGWSLDGKTIELSGQSCDALQDGATHDLDITVECDVVF